MSLSERTTATVMLGRGKLIFVEVGGDREMLSN